MPVILDIAKDRTRDKYLRRLAIEAMIAIGEAGDESAVTVLIGIVSDTPREPDTDAAYLCGEALHALRTFRPATPDATDVLARLVRISASRYLRHEAVYTLGEIRSDPSRTVPTLVWLATHEPGDPQLRIEAIEVISGLGFAARAALPSFAAILDESNPHALQSGVYLHTARSFASIAAEVGNRADLLDIWSLWRSWSVLRQGRRALLRNSGNAFREPVAAIDKAMDGLLQERDSRPLPTRCAFQLLEWRFYLALPWIVLAIIWAVICQSRPHWIYTVDRLVDNIRTPKQIWFILLPREIRIGFILSRVLLVHFFLRCPRVVAVRRMHTVRNAIKP